MMELSVAYLIAAGLIGGLIVLARKNREQGWRHQRGTWLDIQSAAATRAFQAARVPASPHGPLQHMGDLDRLQQSLTAHGVPQQPETEETKALLRSR